MATSTIKNVDQYNVVAKVQVACASDSPTTSEIKAGIVKLVSRIGTGAGVIDLKRTAYIRSSCYMSLVSDMYGYGLLISYYTNPKIQRVSYIEGTVTLSSL